MAAGTTSTTPLDCPAKCGPKEECYVHQEMWEPTSNVRVFSNYTYCNHCGYTDHELHIPKTCKVVMV